MNAQNIVMCLIVPEQHKFSVKKTKCCDFRLVGQGGFEKAAGHASVTHR